MLLAFGSGKFLGGFEFDAPSFDRPDSVIAEGIAGGSGLGVVSLEGCLTGDNEFSEDG